MKIDSQRHHSGTDGYFAAAARGHGCREGSRRFHIVAVDDAVIFAVLLVRYYELIFGVYSTDH